MSRLTIFSAALIVALAAFPTWAQESSPAERYCNSMASYAEAVAKDRDDGTPEHIALDIASQHEDPHVRRDLIWLVQFIHANRDTPEKLASYTFAICWETYGE